MVFAAFWIIYLGCHEFQGPYLLKYNVAAQLIGTPWRLLNGLLFLDRADFTRIDPAASVHGNENYPKKGTTTVLTEASMRQKLLDALEIGFVATRGVGWYGQPG